MAESKLPWVYWANDQYHAPPWKVREPRHDNDIWGVTSDRGDPRKEYDMLEDPPEWLVRLIVAAPQLLAQRDALLAALECNEAYRSHTCGGCVGESMDSVLRRHGWNWGTSAYEFIQGLRVKAIAMVEGDEGGN